MATTKKTNPIDPFAPVRDTILEAVNTAKAQQEKLAGAAQVEADKARAAATEGFEQAIDAYRENFEAAVGATKAAVATAESLQLRQLQVIQRADQERLEVAGRSVVAQQLHTKVLPDLLQLCNAGAAPALQRHLSRQQGLPESIVARHCRLASQARKQRGGGLVHFGGEGLVIL